MMIPLRMSMGDPCALRAYYRLTEEENEADYQNIKFRVGKALEPVVVQLLADNGLDVFFALDDQLEIAHDDPWRIGHPDGLVRIGETRNVGLWLAERLPPDALLRLFQGETAVLEVKTLNAANFRLFRRKGYDLSNSLMRTYYAQLQAYINTLAEPYYDELWNSELYRQFARQYQRPSWGLVVAFSKGTEEVAMHVVERDEEFFRRMNERLARELFEPMRQGLIPAPTYDGRNDECYWCDYRRLCPAAQGVAEDLRNISDVPLEAPPSSADPRLISTATRYQQIAAELQELERERNELREKLIAMVPEGETLSLGNGLAVRHVKVAGRKTLDTSILEVYAAKYGFDLPYKQGKPYSTISVTLDKEALE